MASPYSMVPTGAPNTTWGGGALGGIAQTALSGFNGFMQGQQYLDKWRAIQTQRMLDQFAVPAKAAEFQAQFQQNALAAQLDKQQYIALAAALRQRINNQGAMPMDGQRRVAAAVPQAAAPWPQIDPNAGAAITSPVTTPDITTTPIIDPYDEGMMVNFGFTR